MTDSPRFETDFVYHTREERAQYVWLKYQSILRGKKILDVGADECHLKKWLSDDCEYWGIGLGGSPDQEVDLESGPLPFEDGEYDIVICCDVLEHLEKIHVVFDELCRVSKEYVIISLPNCLGYLWRILVRYGKETDDTLMKYYGLPAEPVLDRHKWFFDSSDARKFIQTRAGMNGMTVTQIDCMTRPWTPRRITRFRHWLCKKLLLRPEIELSRLQEGPVWAVLKHSQSKNNAGLNK